MALYEYCCNDCEKVWEEWHSMENQPEIKCECGKKARRVFGVGDIQFTGHGFYVTDKDGKRGKK